MFQCQSDVIRKTRSLWGLTEFINAHYICPKWKNMQDIKLRRVCPCYMIEDVVIFDTYTVSVSVCTCIMLWPKLVRRLWRTSFGQMKLSLKWLYLYALVLQTLFCNLLDFHQIFCFHYKKFMYMYMVKCWIPCALDRVGAKLMFHRATLISDCTRLMSRRVWLMSDCTRLMSRRVWLMSDYVRLMSYRATLMSDCARLMSYCSRLMSYCARLIFDCARLMFDCARLMFDYARLMFDCARLMFDCARLMSYCAKLMSDCAKLMSDCARLMSHCARLISYGTRLMSHRAMLILVGRLVEIKMWRVKCKYLCCRFDNYECCLLTNLQFSKQLDSN